MRLQTQHLFHCSITLHEQKTSARIKLEAFQDSHRRAVNQVCDSSACRAQGTKVGPGHGDDSNKSEALGRLMCL